ncbi:MAG: hypothetical protein C5B50_22085 [Verrucomicrobia bacterium]|nr:MAG: hypothetical protein C5B50_22085 [Verrucomicrobiota bacterium]
MTKLSWRIYSCVTITYHNRGNKLSKSGHKMKTSGSNKEPVRRANSAKQRAVWAACVMVIVCAILVMFVTHAKRETPVLNTRVEAPAQATGELKTMAVPSAAPRATKEFAVQEAKSGVSDSKPPAAQKKDGNSPKPKPETASAPVKGDEKVFEDPFARQALTLVGADEDAEAYWLEAIYDTSLPKSERQDLIDDLNEEGLPDPKHPTLDDLPLIMSRLQILELIAPEIPGELDWRESYDDLANLAAVALGGGKPVN